MTSIEINTILGLGITFFAGTIWLLLGRSEKKPAAAKKEVLLQDLSQLWIKNGEVNIADLAPIWRDDPVEQAIDVVCIEFQSARIQEFYKKHILPLHHAPQQQAVCRDLLSLLDTEGNCPSVVNVSRDVEATWDSNTYTLLGQTNLLDHCLNVAEQAVRLLREADTGYLIPDTIIAALSHDLGKLPSIRGHLYSLGEHPLAAGRILVGLQSFKELHQQEAILQAVKLHHKQPQDFLGKTLKRADQLARQQELEQAQERLQPLEKPPQWHNQAQAQEGIFEEKPETKKKTPAPRLINLSWLNTHDFLQDMVPYINKLEGRRFRAFSMPNGVVYFMPKILELIARKQAEKAGVLDVVSMDEKAMREVLLSIVHQLRQVNVIEGGLLQDQYFGAYFTVTMKSGTTMNGYYTPCHAEAFGSIAVMEDAKSGILLDLVSVAVVHGDKQA
ncbi:HD domain-containing protein [Desulforhopalus sp. IMCC35007]|uniref:HD domain-containing protein n=1 Tax=Desulforhopalus sp. IMCC35007 TaxID=2569543 RepID=UPI0010AE67D7|nr:HD domain-containing protein [Desulforhopalus sp. IMCC35007]TKB12318.1 HD domain-containing protein [Desulforhopalus sp. IMCC35007]